MIKHLITLLWNQRKNNGWIFLELLFVSAALWLCVDTVWTSYQTYKLPMGFDITNTWRLNLSTQNELAKDFVPESERTLQEGEDLTVLVERLKQMPEVASACITFFSSPYSYGNTWTNLFPADADSSDTSYPNCWRLIVSKDYFETFQLKDIHGASITEQLRSVPCQIVLTEVVAQDLFPNQEAIGKQVKFEIGTDQYLPVVAINPPIRTNKHEISHPAYWKVSDGEVLNAHIKNFGSHRAELSVRMKQALTQEQMNSFLAKHNEQLSVENLYVTAVRSTESIRDEHIYYQQVRLSRTLAISAFLLLNVFFGVVGTFWIRTRQRRGEMGLRLAMGASYRTIYRYAFAEGLLLLAFTLPFVLLFLINMHAFGLISEATQDVTWYRMLSVTSIVYGLLSSMLLLGIWIPMQKAVSLSPSEALRCE